MDEIKEMKKEIHNLKRRTLYLSLVFAFVSVTMLFTTVRQLERYATIQDYYFETLELDREMNQSLLELNPKLEEILSNLQ